MKVLCIGFKNGVVVSVHLWCVVVPALLSDFDEPVTCTERHFFHPFEFLNCLNSNMT
jgi:hypothetical protein